MVKYLENVISKDEAKKLVDIITDFLCNNQNRILTYDAYGIVDNSTSANISDITECSNLLHDLTPLITQTVGFDVEPISILCRQYDNGGILRKHIDDDMGITFSVCIDKTFEHDWPLCSYDYDGVIHCNDIKIGDGMLIYNSHELYHWRDELKCGSDEYGFYMFLHWKKIEQNVTK